MKFIMLILGLAILALCVDLTERATRIPETKPVYFDEPLIWDATKLTPVSTDYLKWETGLSEGYSGKDAEFGPNDSELLRIGLIEFGLKVDGTVVWRKRK